MLDGVIAFIIELTISIAVSAVLALPIMWLWDGVVTVIFNMKEITFLQAWGLAILCNFLFKSNETTAAS